MRVLSLSVVTMRPMPKKTTSGTSKISDNFSIVPKEGDAIPRSILLIISAESATFSASSACVRCLAFR